MAKFNVFTGNLREGPLESIQEHKRWIEEGLRALGHDVSDQPNDMDSNRTAIMFEWFQPGEEKFLNWLLEKGAVNKNYIIVVTEKMNGGSFNERSGGTVVRYRNYKKAAERARQIWTFVAEDQTAHSYLKRNPGFLELGWCDAMHDPVPQSEHTFDFTMHGTGSDRRKAIVEALRAKGHKVAYHHAVIPIRQKDAEQRLARVVLSPRMFGWFPIPSGTRIARAMHTNSACAVEWCPKVPRPQCYSPMSAEGQDFVEFCEEIHANYRLYAAEATERYRTEMPPIADCVQRALDGHKVDMRTYQQ